MKELSPQIEDVCLVDFRVAEIKSKSTPRHIIIKTKEY